MAQHEDEQWRPVIGSDGYEVSSLGRVRNLGTARILEPVLAGAEGNQYAAVSVERRRKKSTLAYVHQLVAEAFLGPRPRGYYTAFKDEDKANAAAANLEYITPEEHGRRSAGRKLRQAVTEIAAKLDRRSLALVDEIVPAIAKLSRSWPDFGVSAARCGHLNGYADLLKKLARFELATMVRYCLYLERNGTQWTALSSPPSGRPKT